MTATPERETTAGQSAAAPVRLRPPQVIKTRRDFLAAARGRRAALPSLLLQGRLRGGDDADPPRVGYTCSKKVGNAVRRNRAKRRLRAAAAEVITRHGRPGWDYVLIGRRDATAARPWPKLLEDLERALETVHRDRGRGR